MLPPSALLQQSIQAKARLLTSKLSSSSSMLFVVNPLHTALLVHGTRRHVMTTIPSQQLYLSNTTLKSWICTTCSRYEDNFARLHARRMLELAMMSAASRKFVTQLEEGSRTVYGENAESIIAPRKWEQWHRRDWTHEWQQAMGATPLERAWQALTRVVKLAVLASPMTVLVPMSYLSSKAQDYAWSYALWSIETAGPTFVKLVQWATTRHDMFSPEFCQYFAKLRDDTKGHEYQETLKILEQEWHQDTHDLLDMQPTPIGSGCIAQVYRGKLKHATGMHPAGTEVAIKVQHPGIWQKVCADFYVLATIAEWLENLPYLNLHYLSLVDSIQQFRDIMLPQLNLELEAQHLQRFNVDFANDDCITFPQPLMDYTTKRVLVETFCHGQPILEYINKPIEVRRQLAQLGMVTTLKMIFLHDFIHGDLHPGNILVSEKSQTTTSVFASGTVLSTKLQLHLLDCGIVLEMGPEQHVHLVKILGAFTRRKGRLAGSLMVDSSQSVVEEESDPSIPKGRHVTTKDDVELFVKGIEKIVLEDENYNFVEKVGDYIADICYLACKHRVKLEASFVNAALAVEITEGIASALYPDITIGDIALPLVTQAEVMHQALMGDDGKSIFG